MHFTHFLVFFLMCYMSNLNLCVILLPWSCAKKEKKKRKKSPLTAQENQHLEYLECTWGLK